MSRTTQATRMSWFKMDVGAFTIETTGLSATHVGIYWAGGHKLPTNMDMLKRRAVVVTEEEREALNEVLEMFFPDAGDGQRFHEGLDRQLDSVKETSAQNSANARRRSPAADAPEKPRPQVGGPDF